MHPRAQQLGGIRAQDAADLGLGETRAADETDGVVEPHVEREVAAQQHPVGAGDLHKPAQRPFERRVGPEFVVLPRRLTAQQRRESPPLGLVTVATVDRVDGQHAPGVADRRAGFSDVHEGRGEVDLDPRAPGDDVDTPQRIGALGEHHGREPHQRATRPQGEVEAHRRHRPRPHQLGGGRHEVAHEGQVVQTEARDQLPHDRRAQLPVVGVEGRASHRRTRREGLTHGQRVVPVVGRQPQRHRHGRDPPVGGAEVMGRPRPRGVEEVVGADHEQRPDGRALGDETVGLLRGVGERLLAEDRPASRGQARPHVLSVERGWAADGHDVDIRVGEQVVEAGGRPCAEAIRDHRRPPAPRVADVHEPEVVARSRQGRSVQGRDARP